MYKSRELLQTLEEIKENLSQVLKVKERAVSKAPNGCLRISRRGKKIQYYQIEGNTGTHGKYLRKKSETLIKALAQKTYDRKLIVLIKKQLELINTFIRQELFTGMDNLYRSQSTERKSLIAPLWIPDDEYLERWESFEFTGLAFRPDDANAFYTEKENGHVQNPKSLLRTHCTNIRFHIVMSVLISFPQGELSIPTLQYSISESERNCIGSILECWMIPIIAKECWTKWRTIFLMVFFWETS